MDLLHLGKIYFQICNISAPDPQNLKCFPPHLVVVFAQSIEASLVLQLSLLSGEPDYFGRNEISSGGDLSHYSSASLY